jgi:hypothetical protein
MQRQVLITDYYKDGRTLFPNTNPETYINSGLVLNKIPVQPATNFFGIKYIRPPPSDSGQYHPLYQNMSSPFKPTFTRRQVQKQFNPNSG